MSNLLKNLLIALGLAIILFIGYVVFVKGDGESATISESGTLSKEAELETQRLLATLNELKSLNVDGQILTDKLFLSLRDLRVDLGAEASGRQNPFAPVE
jgi:hypothetical protein